MSTLISSQLPALDCHAHVATDVTDDQLRGLGDATVFAVTRSLDEAAAASRRTDANLVWGCGVHPGVRAAVAAFDAKAFAARLDEFALVGEVGLDRRSGHLDEQTRVFRAVLSAVREAPVLMSVHSAGCATEVTTLVEQARHPGMILHWFLGDASAVRRAADAGCYFSVNAAMSDAVLRQLPPDRLLPETDFPSTRRKGGGSRPGDVSNLERRVATLLAESAESVRWRWYRNLRSAALASGALERLPDALADRLMAV